MHASNQIVWHPQADWRDKTMLGELAKRLNASDYDSVLKNAFASPQQYWTEVMQHLRFLWRDQPYSLRRDGDDAALPQWFPGGSLNWVDSVFQHAHGPLARTPAILAENEAGQIESVDYADLPHRVQQIAGGLARLGVQAGDRVGLMMPMNTHAVLSFLAIASLGGIVVPLFSGFGVEAAAARLRLAGAGWLLATGTYVRRGKPVSLDPTLSDLRDALPSLRIVVDGPTQLQDCEKWRELEDTTGHAPVSPRAMDSMDPFMIVFTSGTTGPPKGTVHTHAGFPLKVVHDCAYHFDLRSGHKWLWPSDMGWIVGPITTVGGLMRGATLVCYDGAPDFPAAARLAQVIDRHEVTHFGASPTLVRSLAKTGAATLGAKFRTLKLLILAGEVIDPEHFQWFFREFGRAKLPVINYTGGTEASGALLANVPVRPIKPCAFNSVSPGVDAFVADSEGKRLRGTVGELVIGGPFVGMTHGFWKDAQRYLDTYWTQRSGLWSHGDLATEDSDGHFYLLGRADDTLKIAGKRVGPAEVEDLVLEIAEVKEVAAVGLHDPVKGQMLVLCVVRSAGCAYPEKTQNTISARIERHLGKPFRPARIYFVESLPKTRNGKLLRRVIRSVLEGHSPGDLSSLENPEAINALNSIHERSAQAESRHDLQDRA